MFRPDFSPDPLSGRNGPVRLGNSKQAGDNSFSQEYLPICKSSDCDDMEYNHLDRDSVHDR